MKSAWRRLVLYVRHDLREIIAPSSLPDPPGVKPERRLTLREWRQLWSETWRDYKASWKSGSDEEPAAAPEAGKAEDGVNGAQLREDIGVIGRGGAAQLRPILQRMYAERLAALQDAGRAFVDGYRDGLEKAKQDTLLEELADKLWRQTAPDKGQGQPAEGGPSSPHQPPQHGEAAAKHSPSMEDAAPTSQTDGFVAEEKSCVEHQRQRASAQVDQPIVDGLLNQVDGAEQQQQQQQQQQSQHGLRHDLPQNA